MNGERRIQELCLVLTIGAAVLAGAGAADANPIMDAGMYELTQEGQDVRIVMWMLGGTDATHTIVRESEEPGYTKLVVANRRLDDGVYTERQCLRADIAETCADPDASCWDCDGDGEAECIEECTEVPYVDVIDRCVFPGRAVYKHWIGRMDDYDTVGIEITVADTGAECDYVPATVSDCSVAGLGSRPVSVGVFVTLLGVGLITLRRGRIS